MNTSGSGGFLFSVTKVYDDPSASSVMAHRQHKKPKLEPTKVMQSGLADTVLSVREASDPDMDLTTYGKSPDPDLSSCEQTANQ